MEARKIWGGVVNTSRTFGFMVKDFISNEHTTNPVSKEDLQHEIKTLTYRHIAWMTALRYAMRSPKPWEVILQERTNKEWEHAMQPPEKKMTLEDALEPYLSEDEKKYVLSKGNKQTAILNLQSKHLTKIKDQGLIWEFSY